MAEIIGTPGNDTLTGGPEDDVIDGLAGNDTLRGEGGDDILTGGEGNDLIDGGDGFDQASYAAAIGGVFVSLNISGPQDTLGNGIDELRNIEWLVGSEDPDQLTGNDEDNRLDGRGGNNSLYGLGGNDILTGGDMPDYLNGGTGADFMSGGGGNDTYVVDNPGDVVEEFVGGGFDKIESSITYALSDGSSSEIEQLFLTGNLAIDGFGNSLNNQLNGNNAANTLDGRDGNDTLYGMGGDDLLIGGAGNDRLFGAEGNDRLFGGTGADVLSGGAGDDLLFFGDLAEFESGTAPTQPGSRETMQGGPGDDIMIVDDSDDQVTEFANEGTDTVRSWASFRLSANIENLVLLAPGLSGTGNELANELTGNAGDEVLKGLAGDDTLTGLDGDDRLIGGLGADRMTGGNGNDIYYVDNTGDQTIELAGGGNDLVYAEIDHTLADEIETLVLMGTGSLSGTGNAADNRLIGNIGDNVLAGGDGNDRLEGRDGDDQLSGDAGNDKLFGGNGADLVDGGDGDDWLEGGAGRDEFTGGAGSDRFVFREGDFGGATAATADVIRDFSASEGDRIRLDLVDGDTTLGGRQSLSFIGAGAFTGTAGELRYEQAGENTVIEADTNGDGSAEFAILLTGQYALTDGNFIL